MDYSFYISQKIIQEAELLQQLSIWKLKNESVVFTNGCFDILHRGHIQLLTEAAALGDHLIVGLNSDASVKRLKGNDRPFHQQQDRAFLLAALEVVDAVIFFNEDTPLNLIHIIRPNFLVKGGDYQLENIVGADFVLQSGGEVHIVHTLEGYSTTKILQQKP